MFLNVMTIMDLLMTPIMTPTKTLLLVVLMMSLFLKMLQKYLDVYLLLLKLFCYYSLSNSELIDNDSTKKIGGSLPGKSANNNRNFHLTYHRLIAVYFSGPLSVCNEVDFTRGFRVDRDVFPRIYEKVVNKGLFSYKKDATGKYGIHPLVRTVSCFRFFAYGDCFDRCDEYLQISETSMSQSVKEFCKILINSFGNYYLNRSPTIEERNQILAFNTK
jgi:hypothetical protein